MRIFFASDLHGSDRCYRKFLNAATFYKADWIVMGGDAAGKQMVPLVRIDGTWTGTFQGARLKAETDRELEAARRQPGRLRRLSAPNRSGVRRAAQGRPGSRRVDASRADHRTLSAVGGPGSRADRQRRPVHHRPRQRRLRRARTDLRQRRDDVPTRWPHRARRLLAGDDRLEQHHALADPSREDRGRARRDSSRDPGRDTGSEADHLERPRAAVRLLTRHSARG